MSSDPSTGHKKEKPPKPTLGHRRSPVLRRQSRLDVGEKASPRPRRTRNTKVSANKSTTTTASNL
ncbi:hypothetical protein C922_05874 [Plasmodium inui San Antonio 1]|uniref:Uncharacterized protein n=1 Tax=Plasmodium inui San Antonio 1 TaxID=1237626 RepID=W7AEQ1_9APIC|nr:hypothetical protein C922_05874 [Plasmodium inui San Antonio 1]EUD60162.1 hypothetical protein C922_05874 [Plasmodium inui San Antonio 1]